MKKAIFVIVLYFGALFNGYSQTKQEMIKELFSLMRQDSLLDKSFGSMLPAMMSQMQVQAKDSAARARTQEAMKMMTTVTMPLMKEIVKKMMSEDMVAIYDYHFTESEIKDFIAFYKSPSGQKFIKETPAIQKDLMMVMFQKYIPELQKALKEKTEEIKEKENK